MSMQKIMSASRKRKKGFTLTEIAIVLGIVGLILGAVWAAAKNVYSNVNSTKATEVASILVANVRGAYGSNPPAAIAPGSPDFSPAFSSITFPVDAGRAPGATAGKATAVPAMVGAYDANDFVIYMDGTTHSLGTDSVGLAACAGIIQMASALGGSSFATLAAASGGGKTCGVAADCANVASETVSCYGGDGKAGDDSGKCSYSSTTTCSSTNTGRLAVVVPYSP